MITNDKVSDKCPFVEEWSDITYEKTLDNSPPDVVN
jgi:hypothetical protein